MTQVSLASQQVSQNLEVWFYRQSNVTEESAVSNRPLWAEADNGSFGPLDEPDTEGRQPGTFGMAILGLHCTGFRPASRPLTG